jgi:hypothetical protein
MQAKLVGPGMRLNGKAPAATGSADIPIGVFQALVSGITLEESSIYPGGYPEGIR